MEYGIVIASRDYEAARDSGYDYVEFSGREIAALDAPAFETLRQQVTDGPPCLGLNAYCPAQVVIAGPGFDPDMARRYAEGLAVRAAALGVRVVGVGSPFSRTLPAGFDRALAWRQAVRFFRETALAFAGCGIEVCVEALGPCYCNFVNRLDEAVRLAQEADQPNLGVVLDFYNMEHSGEADADLRPYASWIRHAHISDDAGDPRRRAYLRPDRRAVHAQRVQGLATAGYDGRISLEIDVAYDAREAAQSLQMLRQTRTEEE